MAKAKQKPAPPEIPKEWPAARTEPRWTRDLVPYARNAKMHTDEQVAKIAKSMGEWGWTMPVLVDEDNGIIAGHGRVLAASLKKYDVVPVMVARGWSESQRRAYVIADNKLTEAAWDQEILSFEMGALDLDGFDLSLTGFDQDDGGRDVCVANIEVPKGVNFVWALIGVPISMMGDLSSTLDKFSGIEGVVVEVSDDFVEQ